MIEQSASSSAIALRSDDLDVLRRFLEAWCEENDVDMANEAAADIASALIDWYRSDVGDRNLLKSDLAETLPQSDRLQQLLRQLKDA